MLRIIIIFFILISNVPVIASVKDNIIKNLTSTKNLVFNFEQNINGKILVSNGKSLVIKTNNGTYYKYSITKTPLDYILDKKFLLKELQNLEERIIDNKFINFTIFKNENEINIFFDKKKFNLIGWQILDIYQNLNITYLSSIKKNQTLKKNIFKPPLAN